MEKQMTAKQHNAQFTAGSEFTENQRLSDSTPASGSLFDWLTLCSENDDMLMEYDRLNGSNLSRNGTTLEIMVDDSTGKYKAELEGFVAFCIDLYFRMQANATGEPSRKKA